jgi:AcrR family transcriptional regulator
MATRKTAPLPDATTPSRRVRRGNQEDAARMRRDLMRAAVELVAEQGVQAVSIRAIAARVGVSPMTTYRYFDDKAGLFGGIWEMVLCELETELRAALARGRGARDRHRAFVDGFLRFWQARPDFYALLYGFTEVGAPRVDGAVVRDTPSYARVRELQARVTEEFAAELGVLPTHAKAAADVRFAMVLGFLHGTMVVTRYDWTEAKRLQRTYVDVVVSAVEQVLRGGVAPATPRTEPSPHRSAAHSPRADA